jgi:hypothetical protein
MIADRSGSIRLKIVDLAVAARIFKIAWQEFLRSLKNCRAIEK